MPRVGKYILYEPAKGRLHFSVGPRLVWNPIGNDWLNWVMTGPDTTLHIMFIAIGNEISILSSNPSGGVLVV